MKHAKTFIYSLYYFIFMIYYFYLYSFLIIPLNYDKNYRSSFRFLNILREISMYLSIDKCMYIGFIKDL